MLSNKLARNKYIIILNYNGETKQRVTAVDFDFFKNWLKFLGITTPTLIRVYYLNLAQTIIIFA
jgi:hypothetical protein